MEGSFFVYKHHNGKLASIVGLSCQTDFAARTTHFKNVGEDLALHVASSSAESLEELLEEFLVMAEGETVGDYLRQAQDILGESVDITTFERFVL